MRGNKFTMQIGDATLDRHGEVAKLVEFNEDYHVTMEFSNGHRQLVQRTLVARSLFSNKSTTYKNGSKVTISAGDMFANCNGDTAEVLEYKSAKEVKIRFLGTGFETTVQAKALFARSFKDPYQPSIYGVGFVGAKYQDIEKNAASHNAYYLWNGMLRRCYKEDRVMDFAYLGCTVAKDWHNFENFYEFCQKSVGFGVDDWQLDKDILCKNNRTYSENTCVFVPREINSFFQGGKNKAKGIPVGIYLRENGKSYRVILGVGGKLQHHGQFTTIEEAFAAYKKAKEAHIKTLAEKYKGRIDPRAYKALMEYSVEITD